MAAESPQRYLTTKSSEDGKNDEDTFRMEPDISLKESERVVFILDAKWKEIQTRGDDRKHGIDQRDMYQLYAYGKRYGCRAVALVYPQTDAFKTELHYRFFDGLPLICLPFDVAHPEGPKDSVRRSIQSLSRICRSRE